MRVATDACLGGACPAVGRVGRAVTRAVTPRRATAELLLVHFAAAVLGHGAARGLTHLTELRLRVVVAVVAIDGRWPATSAAAGAATVTAKPSGKCACYLTDNATADFGHHAW